MESSFVEASEAGGLRSEGLLQVALYDEVSLGSLLTLLPLLFRQLSVSRGTLVLGNLDFFWQIISQEEKSKKRGAKLQYFPSIPGGVYRKGRFFVWRGTVCRIN